MTKTKRESIPRSIRNSFAHETNIQKPICPVCLCEIESADEMEIAHIESCFEYGNNDIYNLIATHSGMCNEGTSSLTALIEDAPIELKGRFLRFYKSCN